MQVPDSIIADTFTECPDSQPPPTATAHLLLIASKRARTLLDPCSFAHLERLMPVFLPSLKPQIYMLAGIAELHERVYVLKMLLMRLIPAVRWTFPRQELSPREDQHGVQRSVRFPAIGRLA